MLARGSGRKTRHATGVMFRELVEICRLGGATRLEVGTWF